MIPPERQRHVLLGLIVSLLVTGCSSDTTTGVLVVDLHTDLIPGIEFTGVEVALFEDIAALGGSPVRRVDEFALRDTGTRFQVASFSLPDGPWTLRSRLLSPLGAVVLEQRTVVEVTGNTSATVVMTRSCAGISCPGAADAVSALACLGGRCVDPRCTPESPSFCPAPECQSTTDCAAVAACAEQRCDFGVCLPVTIPFTCGSDLWCHPEDGCVSVSTDHCVDGVRNAGETNIDCGGACEPCVVGSASVAGYAWQPVFQGVSGLPVRGIWGTALDNRWAVVQGGFVLRDEGSGFEQQPFRFPQAETTPSTNIFIRGSAQHVWIYGDGPVAHYDGARWSSSYSGPRDEVRALWGADAETVWVGTQGGIIRRYDGSRWHRMATAIGAISDLEASSRNNVWAVAGNTFATEVWRSDGTSWIVDETVPPGDYSQLWPFSAEDVWAAGSTTLAHFDGVGWSTHPVPPGSGPIADLWGAPDGSLWLLRDDTPASLWHRTSEGWQASDAVLADSGKVWGWSESELMVTSGGQVLVYDGTDWQPEFDHATDETNWHAVWGIDPEQVWGAVGSDLVYGNGARWQLEHSASAAAGSFTKLHGSTPNNVWAIGAGRVLARRSASGWHEMTTTTQFSKVWAVGDNNAFAVNGTRNISFFDGSDWQAQDVPYSVRDIWALAADSAWAATDQGVIQFDGRDWRLMTDSPVASVIHGVAGDAMWVMVPFSSEIHRWDGVAWEQTADGLADNLGRYSLDTLWMSSEREVWGLSRSPLDDLGRLRRWDGTRWGPTTSLPLDSGWVPSGLWSPGEGEVWVALGDYTSGGTVLRARTADSP